MAKVNKKSPNSVAVIDEKKFIKNHSKNRTKSKTRSFKEGEVLSCAWDVWISGSKLGWKKKSLIQSLSITETVDGSDTATLEVADPDYLFIEDNIYIEENKIKIMLGWNGYKYRTEFNGYISHVDISFPNDGVPKLTITCMDKTYRMDRKEKSKTYKNTTSAKVVKSICKKYGFKCKVQKGYKFKKQDSISQSNQTDIAFIQQLAQNEVHPFTARLVGNTFYYQKKGIMTKKAKYTLHYVEYPHDIISFDPKIDKVQKTQMSKGSTNTKSKQATSSQISDHYTGKTAVSSNGSTRSKNKSRSTADNTSNTVKSTKSGSNSGKGNLTVKYDKNSREWK